jgi:ABC-type uncharacterized transport system permease subunit
MFIVAWLIERLALRHLVNQEGATLLMATLGIAYVLDGIGQTIFGSAIYKIDVGMPKEPVMMLESVFEGGILINKEDFIAALIAALLVISLSIFFQKTATGRALRAVADDHQAAQSIGIPLNRAGGRHHLGLQTRRAVLFVDHCTAGIAGGDPRRPDLGSRRDYRWPDHRRRRETVRGLSRALRGRRHRDLVCLHAGAGFPPVQAARFVRGENH